jgi:hypothetical protein
MADVRFLAWAGYDLSNLQDVANILNPPEIVVSEELKPSVKGRMDIQLSPRIVHDSVRPFPDND